MKNLSVTQPIVILHAPSGTTVELRAHRCSKLNYSAKLSINNHTVAHAYAYQTQELDQNTLILDSTYIPLLPESTERAKAFLKDTANYKKGDAV